MGEEIKKQPISEELVKIQSLEDYEEEQLDIMLDVQMYFSMVLSILVFSFFVSTAVTGCWFFALFVFPQILAQLCLVNSAVFVNFVVYQKCWVSGIVIDIFFVHVMNMFKNGGLEFDIIDNIIQTSYPTYYFSMFFFATFQLINFAIFKRFEKHRTGKAGIINKKLFETYNFC